MPRVIVKTWTEGHGETDYLELYLCPSPRLPGKEFAMLTGHRFGDPNPGYMDFKPLVAPYPIQTIGGDDAVRMAIGMAGRDGYSLILVKDGVPDPDA